MILENLDLITIPDYYEGITKNLFVKLTVTTSLEEYPTVAPVYFDINTFFLKSCIIQAISQVDDDVYYIFSNGVGQPKSKQPLQPFVMEVDYFLD